MPTARLPSLEKQHTVSILIDSGARDGRPMDDEDQHKKEFVQDFCLPLTLGTLQFRYFSGTFRD